MARNLFVKLRRLLEGSPLLAIVAEDDDLDLFALDPIEKHAGAGNKVRFVGVLGAGFTLHRERMLHPNGINREQDTTGLRQALQNGLVVRSMAAGFEEGKAGKKLRVAIDETSAARDGPSGRVREQSPDACCGRVRGARAGRASVGAMPASIRMRFLPEVTIR